MGFENHLTFDGKQTSPNPLLQKEGATQDKVSHSVKLDPGPSLPTLAKAGPVRQTNER